MSTVTIRKLVRKDRVTLAALIKKLADSIGSTQLLNMISADKAAATGSDSNDASVIAIGTQVLKLLIETLEDGVAEWFANLCGKTIEEFNEMPFDTDLQIIEQLIISEEAKDFFTGASRLSSAIKGLADRLPKPKRQ